MMKCLTSFKIFVLIVLCCLTHAASLFGMAQRANSGNVIYIRNQSGDREAIDYATGQATSLNQNHCIRFSTHFDVLASYRLENPEQLTFTRLATGAIIAQQPWHSEWGTDRQSNPTFCTLANKWLDNTTFRLPSAQSPDQYYDVNISTGEVTGPVTVSSIAPELPLMDPDVSELGLGVDATLSSSGDQAIYSQCVDAECNQTRYVLLDVRQQQVLAELRAPDFGFYYARRVPGYTVFSWSHDEQYIAISSENAVLAVYDNARNGWVDLGFLPPSFREINQTTGGWNWSPDNTQIAFGVQGLTAMGYSFDTGIMTIDLVSRTYRAFELNVHNIMNIVWLPSGDGLLIAFADGELYRLNFSDESLQLFDDHVSSLFAWYSPISAPPTPTDTPTPSPTATATPTPMATPPSSALVLGLGFEAGSGTTAVDSSTYQNAGTLLNGATWTTEGKFGSAIAFDGVDDRVSVADANSLDLTTGLTVEAWVKPTQTNDWSTIVMKELTSGEAYVLYGWYYGANTAAITSYAGYERIVQGGGLLPLNMWTHVAMTFDGEQQILYLNGQVAGSANVTGAIMTSDLPLSIGGNGLFSNEVFQGVIDEVRVYNVALSQTEIQQDMNSPVGTVPYSTPTPTPLWTPTPMATPPSSALVLGLGFEAGSGTTVVDSSTYQNAGTLLNGATWTTEGKFGNAIAFDGVDDRVSVADANSLDLTTGLTVEAWVKPTQANDWSTIVMKELTSGEAYVLYGWFYGTNTAAITSYAGYARIVQGGGLLPLNTWTHVAMTFDGAEQILYINGQVIASQTVIGTITTSDLPLSIGGNSLFSNEGFQGVIDEVRVYNVALSQTEIQQDMNSPVE